MKKLFFSLAVLCCAFAVQVRAQEGVLKVDGAVVEDDQTYLVLSTKRIQTMEKELDAVAARGFRVMYGAPTIDFDMALLLENVKKENRGTYSYKILATSRIKTMEKELNELAAQGYRLLPRTILFKQGFVTSELVMLMERAPNSEKKYDYRLITATKETKMHKKMDESIAEGYTPVTMITIAGHVVVMEK